MKTKKRPHSSHMPLNAKGPIVLNTLEGKTPCSTKFMGAFSIWHTIQGTESSVLGK